MARALDPETISGTWLRSHEEEDDPTQIVYRRPSFRFPPSRGREALNLVQPQLAVDEPAAAVAPNAPHVPVG